MPKPPKYEPAIIATLQHAGMDSSAGGGTGRELARGMSAADLARATGCSRNQVYKVIAKLTLAGMVRESGRGETGAKLYVWSGDGEGEGGGEHEGEGREEWNGDTLHGSGKYGGVTLRMGTRTVVAGMDSGPIQIHLDSVFKVMALRRLDGGTVAVELENEAGRRVEIVIEPEGIE